MLQQMCNIKLQTQKCYFRKISHKSKYDWLFKMSSSNNACYLFTYFAKQIISSDTKDLSEVYERIILKLGIFSLPFICQLGKHFHCSVGDFIY